MRKIKKQKIKQVYEKTEELTKWKNRYNWAKNIYDSADNKYGWTRYKNFFLGNYTKELGLDIPVIVINEVYAFVKTGVSNLYSANPYITVNPKNIKGIKSAYIKEQAINYIWREQFLGKQVKRAIFDAKLTGFSWFKIGYEADVELDINDNTNEYIAGENIFAVAIPQTKNNFVLCDSESLDPGHDSKWIMHCYIRSTEYLKEKYNINTLEPNYEIKSENRNNLLSQSDIDKNLVIEVWDKDSGRKMIFTDNYDSFLEIVEPEEKGCIGSYKMEGFPFVMLRFNEILDIQQDNFPMSELTAIEPQILEKIKYRSMMANHLKRYNRQMAFKSGAFKNETEISKYLKSIDGALIEMEVEPQTALYPISYPQIQTDIYATENRTDVDRDRVSGQNQVEQGSQASSKTRTLGELNLTMAGVDKRKHEQIMIVENFCADISRKILALQKQYFDIEKIATITGEPNETILQILSDEGKFDGINITYTKEDIQGEEDVQIVAGSTTPINKDTKIRAILEAAKVGQALGLTPDSNASKVIGKLFFRELGIKEIEFAYEQDMLQAEQNKKPDAQNQMKLLKASQDIKRGAIDAELKKTRITSNNLRNTKQAVDNSQLIKNTIQGKEEQQAGGTK